MIELDARSRQLQPYIIASYALVPGESDSLIAAVK